MSKFDANFTEEIIEPDPKAAVSTSTTSSPIRRPMCTSSRRAGRSGWVRASMPACRRFRC